MKRVLIFIFAAISALSCSEREMSGDLKPDVVQYAEHTFEISLPLDDSTATRSVMNADPDRIKDVCAFAFDAGSGDILRYPNGGGAGDPVMTYVTGSSSFEWSLPLGVEMDIYAVCNMGQITAPSTLSEFLASPDLVYEISDVSDLDGSGVPMTAVLEGIMSDSGSTLVLPARRIVSKYTVRLTDMPYDYEITGIRICNVNSRTTLFARNEAADASSVLIMGDWATEEDLAQLNSGEGAEFYMFENAQTTTGSASLEAGSKWYEVHGQLAEKADFCTYLDIISEHEGEARRDRLYLGRDCTSNFDVIRNTIRHISCPAPISLISGAGQDVLRFAGSCDAFPGETILIPFEYNLSLSEAGPSSITFHADDGLTVGTPVFSSDANGYGTGSIPVTCGSSVSVGEKLSVRMSSGEASADTDVDIINKVISVTISSPSENVKVRSVQLHAEAVFADGTTITDPALFDWKISTSDSSTATVKDGLVSRIGYRYGPVSLTAEFGGVTSNTLQITFDSSIMELYSLPDEVSVSVGKTANMMLLYKISEIGDASGTDIKVTTTHYLNPKDVVYAIKDPDIASVTDGGLMVFKITGNRSGSTSLNIQYDSDHFGTSTLDVPVFVDDYSYELELSKASLEMSVGSSTQLEAYFVTYHKGVEESRINVTDEAVWESSSSSHVKVTNGLVEALMKTSGDEYIYVSYNGYKTQTSVKTVEDETYLLEIYPEYISLDPGEGCQLSAILYKYINGTYDSETDVTSYVYWDVEDRSVATISTKGYLRGLSEGTTRAYAEYDDYYAAATVRVSPSVPDPVITNRLVVSAGQTSFTGGGTTTATATYITYEDGVQTDSKDVTSSASWSTSNSSVATVSFGNISVKDVNGTATITATYEGRSGEVVITASRKDEPEPVVTYDLVVSAGQTSFTGGGTTTATATYITYEDGVQTDSKDVTSSAGWSTNNSSVAAVSRGSIFVKDVNGSAVITATYEGKSDSVTIIAKKKDDPVPVVTYDLVVSPSGIDIVKTGSGYFKATFCTYTDDSLSSSVDVTSSCSWIVTSGSSYVSVSGGKVTGKGGSDKGSATVKASYFHDGFTYTDTGSVSYDPGIITTYRLDVSIDETSFVGGGSTSAHATYVTLEDGVEVSWDDVTSSATWSSSNSSVATVSRGNVSVSDVDGTATIKAVYNGMSDSVDIIAKAYVPTLTYELVVSIGQTSFTGGGSTTATATYITYEDGVRSCSEDVTSSASWSSSNTDVATVSGGAVTIKNTDGSATIKATYKGKSDYVTVSSEYVERGTLKLAWTLLDQEILIGNSTGNAALYYAEGSNSPVNVSSSASWSSSNPSVATVSGGTITAVGEGRATITATYRGLSASCTIGCTESPHVINIRAYTVSVGTNVYKVAVDLTLSDGTVVEDAYYSWECTLSNNTGVVSNGDTGSGPLIYRTSEATWDFSFKLIVDTPDGVSPESVTSGISIKASGII